MEVLDKMFLGQQIDFTPNEGEWETIISGLHRLEIKAILEVRVVPFAPVHEDIKLLYEIAERGIREAWPIGKAIVIGINYDPASVLAIGRINQSTWVMMRRSREQFTADISDAHLTEYQERERVGEFKN